MHIALGVEFHLAETLRSKSLRKLSRGREKVMS